MKNFVHQFDPYGIYFGMFSELTIDEGISSLFWEISILGRWSQIV